MTLVIDEHGRPIPDEYLPQLKTQDRLERRCGLATGIDPRRRQSADRFPLATIDRSLRSWSPVYYRSAPSGLMADRPA